mmetsp:Transcript_29904/g.85816  ORF Transcript_29904/g.85816 Transcript_29904/m.85816 type:complete len:378 (+) Transcript_29904:76-1209(+)
MTIRERRCVWTRCRSAAVQAVRSERHGETHGWASVEPPVSRGGRILRRWTPVCESSSPGDRSNFPALRRRLLSGALGPAAGCLQHQLHGAGHPAGAAEALRLELRRLLAGRVGQHPADGLAHVALVARCRRCRLLFAVAWPVHLQAHAQRDCLCRIHDLVSEARADDDRCAARQDLREAVLAAMGHEEVYACPKEFHLRERGHADGVGWRRDVAECVRLQAQGCNDQRAAVRLRGAASVKDARPSSPAEVPASEATLAVAGGVPTDHLVAARHYGAHADHDHSATCRTSFSHASDHGVLLHGAVPRDGRHQHGANEGKRRAVLLVGLGHCGGRRILQLLRGGDNHGVRQTRVEPAVREEMGRLEGQTVVRVDALGRG